MYTVPGQTYYEASRRLILDGADGVIFIADSQDHRLEENITSFRMMQDNLRHYGIGLDDFPLVLQYNKRDCVQPLKVCTLEGRLNLGGIPVLEAVATEGRGVMETICTLSRAIINRFQM
jgi:signal recognition particle receptor subunit beta